MAGTPQVVTVSTNTPLASANQAAITLTSATLAGTLTGTIDGTIADIAAAAGACAGGVSPSAANVDTAIATAVAPIVSGTNVQLKELQSQLNKAIADVLALKVYVNQNRLDMIALGNITGAA